MLRLSVRPLCSVFIVSAVDEERDSLQAALDQARIELDLTNLAKEIAWPPRTLAMGDDGGGTSSRLSDRFREPESDFGWSETAPQSDQPKAFVDAIPDPPLATLPRLNNSSV